MFKVVYFFSSLVTMTKLVCCLTQQYCKNETLLNHNNKIYGLPPIHVEYIWSIDVIKEIWFIEKSEFIHTCVLK